MYGGPGEEHGVSVNSGKNVISGIDTEKYELHTIFVDKKGGWILDGKERDLKKILKEIKDYLVWSVVHGTYGEDGKLQKILEGKKIKFIGTGSTASKVTMSKDGTQKILEKNKIRYPNGIVLKKYKEELGLHYPVIAKPDEGGSSFGLYKFENGKEYSKKIKSVLKKYNKVLVQEFVVGREFTCGVIEVGKKVVALPVSEVVLTKTAMFDYEAKYTKGACLEVTPAKIDGKLNKKIQEIAKKVHKLTGCKDLSRTDMIMNSKGELVVLEINTAPGMTETSFIPAELAAAGLTMHRFVDILVKNNT